METRQKANEEGWKKLDKDINDPGSAYTAVAGKVGSSEKILKTLSNKQEKIEHYMQEMNEKYEYIVVMLAKMSMSKVKQVQELNVGSTSEGSMWAGRSSGDNRTGRNGNDIRMNHKLPKIDLSQFCGENPRE
ncbi:hypothetical protein Adt_22692 [Abeliophyllum distichum]|uniref:Uncharacterized protein n=1 Tax=Abeliophyllum distichum TaxID=126358 RepID=A0ABD1S8Q0_9LAMI